MIPQSLISMMSAPQETINTQMSSVPYTITGAPQPNTNPITIQWSGKPAPAQPNVYPASPVWNVSPGQPQVVYSNLHPAAPGCNVPGPAMQQVTQPSRFRQIFLQGKPKALGSLLIVMGILQMLVAIGLPFLTLSYTLFSGVPFWGPVFYIIAGSLSIAAWKNNDVCLIKGSLAFNILSSLSSFSGLILNIVDFAFKLEICYYYDYGYYVCEPNAAAYSIISIIFIINLLVFCVSTSASVYGGRAVEQMPSNVSPVFVIQREFVASMPPSNYSVSQADENAKPAQ